MNHMTETQAKATSYPVAVIMERAALSNRWVAERWETKGVVHDTAPAGAPARTIFQSDSVQHVLFPGYRVKLQRHEAEGYYLNITSPQPKVFVLWRMRDDGPRPELLTVSYNEGTRWADSGESVDGVPLPVGLLRWIADFVAEHYQPEPPQRKRYATNKDRGRMGRVE
jgi:uncharacterized protein DUF3305